MAERRRKFDRDFREGAVRLVRETGRPIAQVANSALLGRVWLAGSAVLYRRDS